MEISWDDMKEILGKAAFGGLYAAGRGTGAGFVRL